MSSGSIGTLRRTVGVAIGTAVALAGLLVPSAGATTRTVLEPGIATMLQSLAVDEKLAHDTYVVFGDRYDAVLFDNIAASETRHQEAVAGLLTKHGVTNPTAGDVLGFFDDPAVQSLYNELIARGSGSLSAALEVGVWIEEFDIRELTAILATTVPKDVRQVVTNLLDGSRNHLAAFQAALTGVVSAATQAATVMLVQSAEVRARVSGRYQVGATLLLAARPVVTDAGVTMRWRATVESRDVCTVRTQNGRATVTLHEVGTCRVVGVAPAPSPEYAEYRIQRTYRAVP